MIEHGLVKMSGTKVLGSAFLPSFAVVVVGGIIAWKFWESKNRQKPATGADSRYKETLATLQTKIETLTTELRELSSHLTQFQEKRLEPQNAKTSVKDIPSVGTFINRASQPTKEPAKLAMFKRIIDDNVKLRKIA
ncbi:MAG: hypothetical protein DRR08_00460 [Candidatus Parabeggiatoa sp. nov. 2]|nr:MAG: hypothetical protein B6247_02810 [Beggiatoa sp. 4572_84]RKZ64523.1 MAG: hypothetical protein DRR08_00460 [Gammaproteobacteria bacterium]